MRVNYIGGVFSASQSYATRDLVFVLDRKICFTEIDIIIGKSRTFRCQHELTNVTEIEVATDLRLKIIFIRETGASWTISETLAENWEESIIFESKIQIQGKCNHDSIPNRQKA